jgi:hypothetical protein
MHWRDHSPLPLILNPLVNTVLRSPGDWAEQESLPVIE